MEKLSSDLTKFCNNKQYSDVSFSFPLENENLKACSSASTSIGGHEMIDNNGPILYGHKVILAARSPVFSTMFQSDGQFITKSDECCVTDIDQDTFETLLKFIYSANMDNISLTDDIFLDLLYAAKKYMINELVQLCESYICDNLSLENIYMFMNYSFLLPEKCIGKMYSMITENQNEILLGQRFLEFESSALCDILQSGFYDKAWPSELDLFNSLISWAKAKCKRKELVINGANIRNVLGPALFMVRFPSMTNEDFVQNVVVQKILTNQEELFVFRTIANGGTPLEFPEDNENDNDNGPTFKFNKRQKMEYETCIKCGKHTSFIISKFYSDNRRKYCASKSGYY